MAAAIHYRTYRLPWEADPREQRRFQLLLLIALLVVSSLGLMFHWLQMPPSQESVDDAVPPRLARLMQEAPKPPPPPPPPELPKPPEPKEIPKPDPRQKMEQNTSMRAIRDALADLRDPLDTSALQQRNLTGEVNADSKAERSLIASKVGTGSASNVTANASRGFGAGAGALAGHDTLSMRSGIGAGDGPQATRTGRSGKAARGSEEIELVFDRNKGAIYALYNRALRDNPELKGKLVLELTITPTGEVTDCRVVSSELGDTDLERKIVARVRLFRFEARDVETITARKTIEFFPQ